MRKRKGSKQVRRPGLQVKVRRNDRIRVVSMAAEQRRASDDSVPVNAVSGFVQRTGPVLS